MNQTTGINQTSKKSTQSIGQVLRMLEREFPDVTISKIRFLEGQGLISPERAPSGYRRFSEIDVERLRFILREQRQNFLPLKVIRARLEGKQVGNITPVEYSPTGQIQDPNTVTNPEPENIGSRTANSETGIKTTTNNADHEEGDSLNEYRSYSRTELLNLTGISEYQLRDLEKYGVIDSALGQNNYSYHQVKIVKIAVEFSKIGLDARHLRIFKTSAEREADLYRQLVLTPMTHGNANNNEKEEELLRLAKLGSELRSALLHQSMFI